MAAFPIPATSTLLAVGVEDNFELRFRTALAGVGLTVQTVAIAEASAAAALSRPSVVLVPEAIYALHSDEFVALAARSGARLVVFNDQVDGRFVVAAIRVSRPPLAPMPRPSSRSGTHARLGVEVVRAAPRVASRRLGP
jgi:hypothetical protein